VKGSYGHNNETSGPAKFSAFC